MSLQKAMVSSKTNEWATPQSLFDKLDAEFHYDLDVASTDENTKCYQHYTQKDNGLIQPWQFISKSACWMNPPYGGQTGLWIQKAHEESRKGATVVCLIVSSTDRSYWHDFIFPFAAQIRFIRGRITFGEAKTTAPFASAIVIFSQQEYNPKVVYFQRARTVTLLSPPVPNTTT